MPSVDTLLYSIRPCTWVTSLSVRYNVEKQKWEREKTYWEWIESKICWKATSPPAWLWSIPSSPGGGTYKPASPPISSHPSCSSLSVWSTSISLNTSSSLFPCFQSWALQLQLLLRIGNDTLTCELIEPLFPFLLKLCCCFVELNNNTLLDVFAPRTKLYFNTTWKTRWHD